MTSRTHSVYIARPHGFSQFSETLPPEAHHEASGIQGSPQQNWRPMEMRLFERSSGRFLAKVDMPTSNYGLVLNPRAKDVLEPIFRRDAELLPLDCPGAELWLVNVVRMVDALDEGSSKVVRFASGRIMSIVSAVFYPEVVQDLDAFHVPQTGAFIYYSDRVAEAVAENGLTGMDFIRVWAKNR